MDPRVYRQVVPEVSAALARDPLQALPLVEKWLAEVDGGGDDAWSELRSALLSYLTGVRDGLRALRGHYGVLEEAEQLAQQRDSSAEAVLAVALDRLYESPPGTPTRARYLAATDRVAVVSDGGQTFAWSRRELLDTMLGEGDAPPSASEGPRVRYDEATDVVVVTDDQGDPHVCSRDELLHFVTGGSAGDLGGDGSAVERVRSRLDLGVLFGPSPRRHTDEELAAMGCEVATADDQYGWLEPDDFVAVVHTDATSGSSDR